MIIQAQLLQVGRCKLQLLFSFLHIRRLKALCFLSFLPGGQSQRPGLAAANARDGPGPGAYGPSTTESWLAACLPHDQAAPAFGSSLSRCPCVIAMCNCHV